MEMLAMKNLPWVDCSTAALAGVAVLLLGEWLSGLHALPRGLLLFTGVANLLYASYSFTLSFTLATRSRRRRGLVTLLVAANLS
jgi:hypothetical protein